MIGKIAVAAVCTLVVMAAPSGVSAAPADPFAVPASPFSDVGGVYDDKSQCWIWDAARTAPMKHTTDVMISVYSNCGGAPLSGQSKVRWLVRAHDGETWEGNFTAGKFTGSATAAFGDGSEQIGYVDGLRDGPTVIHFKDGGVMEENYAAGLRDGQFREVFPDGSGRQGRSEKGKTIEVKTCYTDGSCDTEDTHFAAGGKAMKGLFHGPHTDRTNTPPLAYPPISVRLGEQGTALVSVQIDEGGTPHDLRLVRGTGSERLDQAGLAWLVAARFTPATIDGTPVASQLIMPVTYHLKDNF